MTRAEYDSVDAVNWSTLRHIRKSPAHYQHALKTGTPDTDAMRLGRAIHLAVLEPEQFEAQTVVWTGGRRYGKEWDAFREQHAGREILRPDDADLCNEVREAVWSHSVARDYLRATTREHSIGWTDADTGIHCKARLDAVGPSCVIDLKTTRDASPEAFQRSAWNLAMHGQLAWYSDGLAAATGSEPLPVVVIAVESSAPHLVQVYRMDEALLGAGRALWQMCLLRLAECRRSGQWGGYADEELPLSMPRWATTYEQDDDLEGLGLSFGA